MLPGLGDGLITVRGMAAPMAAAYRSLGAHYKVYVFSRKDMPEKGCSTRTMAADQAEAMRALGIGKAMAPGVSQVGMIAQYLAIDFPEMAEKLALAVTTPRAGELTLGTLETWSRLAEQGDCKANQITCPTLVIGGSCGQILGADASRDLADNIGTNELFLYEGLGHGVYEEAGDFQKRIPRFLSQ